MVKYGGGEYYTGNRRTLTLSDCTVQLASWWAITLSGALIGNELAWRVKGEPRHDDAVQPLNHGSKYKCA